MKAEEYDVVGGERVPRLGTAEYEAWENRPEAVASRREYGPPVYGRLYEEASRKARPDGKRPTSLLDAEFAHEDEAAPTMEPDLNPFSSFPRHRSGGDIWRTEHTPWMWRTDLIEPFEEPWEVDAHGESNVGKSEVVLQRVAADILGEDWLGIPVTHRPDQPRRWTLVLYEMSERSWKRRMKNQIPGLTAETLDRFCPVVFTSDNVPNFTKPGAPEAFARLLAEQGITDVMIDPKRFAWPGWDFNTGPHPPLIIEHLRLFKTFGGPRTLWVVSHDRKVGTTGRAGSDGDQMSGDGAFWAASDCGIRLVQNKNGLVELRHHKSREDTKHAVILLRRDPNTGILSPTEAPKTQSQTKQDNLTILEEALRKEPLSAKSMGKLVGLDSKTITREYVPALGAIKVGGGPATKYVLSTDRRTANRGPVDSVQTGVQQ